MAVLNALNGRLPDSLLTHLPWPEAAGFRLRADAAASAGRLATAFRAHFNAPLLLTDAYRTFASQVELKASKGVWAATPGTSNHGLGIAIDFASGINVDGSVQHLWMTANAGRFGWVNPTWATDWNPSNGQHEPWHWEYHPELDITPAPTIPALPTVQEDDMLTLILWCYTNLVGRTTPPKTDEVAGWITATAGKTSAQVLDSFLNAKAEPGSVTRAYADYLHRSAASGEVAGWVARGLTIKALRALIAASPEALTRK